MNHSDSARNNRARMSKGMVLGGIALVVTGAYIYHNPAIDPLPRAAPPQAAQATPQQSVKPLVETPVNADAQEAPVITQGTLETRFGSPGLLPGEQYVTTAVLSTRHTDDAVVVEFRVTNMNSRPRDLITRTECTVQGHFDGRVVGRASYKTSNILRHSETMTGAMRVEGEMAAASRVFCTTIGKNPT